MAYLLAQSAHAAIELWPPHLDQLHVSIKHLEPGPPPFSERYLKRPSQRQACSLHVGIQ